MAKKSPSPTRIRSLPARILAYGSERGYLKQLFKLAVPLTLQNLVTSSLSMVGMVMIGQEGDVALAGVGLAGQLFFLMNLVVFGITSGTGIFTAQLWGKKDTRNIHRVLGLTLLLAGSAAILFFVLAVFFPTQVLGIYSNDPQVISLGSGYLRIYGFAFLFFAISMSYSTVLRSIGNVRVPLIVSSSSLVLNTLLSYALIFGKLGAPAMGVTGAAIATVIARAVECTGIIVVSHLIKSPVAGSIKELLQIDLSFIGRVMKPVLPVALNELLWSLAITTYNAIYAHIGTDAIASMNILSTVENMVFACLNGISISTAVMVGQHIGRGEEDRAFADAGRSLLLVAGFGMLMGGVVFLSTDWVLTLFNVSPDVIFSARRLLTIYGLAAWLRSMNATIVLGILRAGGDTRFSLILDGLIIWVVGVPLVAMGAFLFHLPVYWVYLLAMSEEITKWCLGLARYFSRKWIHNLAHTLGQPTGV